MLVVWAWRLGRRARCCMGAQHLGAVAHFPSFAAFRCAPRRV